MKRKRYPSLRGVLTNWNSNNAPFQKKLRMAMKNNWNKLRQGKSCCGNYGEVGC